MMEPVAPLDEPGPELPRSFGLPTGTAVVVASMVGVGILGSPGYTLEATGSGLALLLLWAVGGLLALAASLTLAEMATGLPRVGGDYVYVREAYGEGVGFVYGWTEVVFGFAAPTTLVAMMAVRYLSEPFDDRLADLPLLLGEPAWRDPILASILILLLAFPHIEGQRRGAWLQNVTTWFKFGSLLVLAVAAYFAPRGSWQHLTTGTPLPDQSAFVLAGQLAFVTYGYAGWNATVYLAGEIRDPARLLPRCLVGGCLLVTLLYLAVNLAYVHALSPERVATMDEHEVEAVANTAAEAAFGHQVAGPLSVVLGLGLVSTVSAFLLLGPRMIFALARDRSFFRYAGTVHPRFGTPAAAILSQAGFAVALCWAGAFRDLFSYTSVGLALASGFMLSSVFVLRRRPGWEPSFRTPLYPLTPILCVVTTIWIVGYMIADPYQRGPAVGSIVSILAVTPIYLTVRWWKRRSDG